MSKFLTGVYSPILRPSEISDMQNERVILAVGKTIEAPLVTPKNMHAQEEEREYSLMWRELMKDWGPSAQVRVASWVQSSLSTWFELPNHTYARRGSMQKKMP